MSVEIFAVDRSLLDPPFDFDFTNLKDDGTKYQRGGREYKRPYGWNRIALNVKNKYEPRDWLLEEGGGEWAVSYHGTSKECAEEIVSTTSPRGLGSLTAEESTLLQTLLLPSVTPKLSHSRINSTKSSSRTK